MTMNINRDAEIPKIFASKPSGKYPPYTIKEMVTVPPTSIDQNAALGFGFETNKPPITGTKSPETIKA